MKKLVLSIAILLSFVSVSNAQIRNRYTGNGMDSHAMNPGVTFAPQGTSRMYNSAGGQTFYSNQGYNGRSVNTGGGSQSVFGKDGKYIGRGQPTPNGGYKFTPTTPVRTLHDMPHTTRHR